MSAITRFLWTDDAATAVEYAVMLALILLTCVATIALLGTTVSDMWTNSNAEMEAHGIK